MYFLGLEFYAEITELTNERTNAFDLAADDFFAGKRAIKRQNVVDAIRIVFFLGEMVLKAIARAVIPRFGTKAGLTGQISSVLSVSLYEPSWRIRYRRLSPQDDTEDS